MILAKIDIDHNLLPDKYRALIFDVDGTLRRCLNPKHPFPVQPSEWEIMPNVLHILQNYYTPRSQIRYSLVTNQSGITKGTVAFGVAYDMLNDLCLKIFRNRDVDIYICHHTKEYQCACRKPSPYYPLRFAHTRNIKRSELLFVGDMLTDFQSADRAGIDFAWSVDFFGW